MSDSMIWIATGIGVLIIVIKLLLVYGYRRLVAMDKTAPDQSED
jgi:hypothetical protein